MAWLWPTPDRQASSRARFLQRLSRQATLAQLDYSFDQPFAGDGWYTREQRDGVYWRFTGPGTTASLYFPRIVAAQRQLALTIHHSVSPAHQDDLQASCNGISLERCRVQAQTLFFDLPATALAAREYTCIELSTPATVQPEGDSRQLGIAVQRVEIY